MESYSEEENKTFQDETVPKELYSNEENKTFQDETAPKELYSDEENKTFQDETIPTELHNDEENKTSQKGKFGRGTDETKLKEVQNKDDDFKSDGKYAEDNKDATKQEETHFQSHQETKQEHKSTDNKGVATNRESAKKDQSKQENLELDSIKKHVPDHQSNSDINDEETLV